MPATIVHGLAWGDEGKRKIIDMLAQKMDMVIRAQGGNNAGGSVKNDEYGEFVLHVIPGGIFNPDAINIIERGVLVHPPSLVEEMEELAARGISFANLMISPYAHMVMPWQIEEDRNREELSSYTSIGTTRKGIGPCVQDKAGRSEALRIADMLNKSAFLKKLERIYCSKQLMFYMRYPSAEIDPFEKIRDDYLRAREYILPYIKETLKTIDRAIRAKKQILIEVAHGTLLDSDYGTFPHVTSSPTTAMAACMYTGISPLDVTRIIGVTKAYMTRVGDGVFPTEFNPEQSANLRALGKEFGATTGRPRRCGSLDLPLIHYAMRVNHTTEVVVTKMDILGLIPEIKLCTRYANHSQHYFAMRRLQNMQPHYEHFEGWGNLSGCTKLSDLPSGARHFLKRLSLPISCLSIGPSRNETIIL